MLQVLMATTGRLVSSADPRDNDCVMDMIVFGTGELEINRLDLWLLFSNTRQELRKGNPSEYGDLGA